MAITKEAVDTAGLSDEHLLDIYYKMRLGRAMGERQRLLQRMGKGSITYSCEGHEGAQVGVAAAMTPGKDWLFPYYRDTAFVLALGMAPRDVLMSFFAPPRRHQQRRPQHALALQQHAASHRLRRRTGRYTGAARGGRRAGFEAARPR